MAKTTRQQRIDKLVKEFGAIANECHGEVVAMQIERDAALVEAKTRFVDCELGDKEITAERLSEFLDHSADWAAWRAKYGRLTFWCREDGSWGLDFDSTYGGGIGSYRNLKTIGEVKVLIELLGVKTAEQLHAAQSI